MTLTAAAFTDDAMLKRQTEVPTGGWQRAVYQLSVHTLNPGPGPAEQHRMDLERRLRVPIEGSHRVVVMSRKGGVGKTTMTLALGSTFATLRGDRVVAVDANPDAGNLAHRVAPPNSRTITDLLERVDDIASYAELRCYVSQAPESRLEVLGSDDDPRIGMALNRDAYHRLIGLLDRFYNLILLDTGTGILDSANQGLLMEADELVLVLRPGLDGGRAAALTLDWLDEHDYGELVAQAIVVINGVRRGLGAPLEPMVKHFDTPVLAGGHGAVGPGTGDRSTDPDVHAARRHPGQPGGDGRGGLGQLPAERSTAMTGAWTRTCAATIVLILGLTAARVTSASDGHPDGGQRRLDLAGLGADRTAAAECHGRRLAGLQVRATVRRREDHRVRGL